MNARRDDGEVGARLLADAVVRACTFEFSAAEALCKRILAMEKHGRHSLQVQALLRAIEHNRSSYLYSLTAKGSRRGPSDPRSVYRRLFDIARNTLWRPEPSDDENLAGSFDVQFEEKGMVVSGSVTDSSQIVYAFINELLVALVPTAPHSSDAKRFSFRINNRSLNLFPASGLARLALSTGNGMLRHVAGGIFYRCEWPGGKGGIEEAIINGAILTAHYNIKLPPTPATIERWLNAYDKLAGFMEARDKPLFLYYGSLLGAVRDNQVIRHDDDFDVAYFSAKKSAPDVKEEMISIIAALAAADADMVIRLMTFFFKINVRGGVIDVFPAWHDGHVLLSPWATCLECDEHLLTQLVAKEFHGRRVRVPARAEEFLELKYGEGWRTPDPAYRINAKPDTTYPFRQIPFGEDDRTRIVNTARDIAGIEAIATVKLMDE